MGSATVVYQRHEDAAKAIADYHGALLDDKVMTVEYDNALKVPKVRDAAGG